MLARVGVLITSMCGHTDVQGEVGGGGVRRMGGQVGGWMGGVLGGVLGGLWVVVGPGGGGWGGGRGGAVGPQGPARWRGRRGDGRAQIGAVSGQAGPAGRRCGAGAMGGCGRTAGGRPAGRRLRARRARAYCGRAFRAGGSWPTHAGYGPEGMEGYDAIFATGVRTWCARAVAMRPTGLVAGRSLWGDEVGVAARRGAGARQWKGGRALGAEPRAAAGEMVEPDVGTTGDCSGVRAYRGTGRGGPTGAGGSVGVGNRQGCDGRCGCERGGGWRLWTRSGSPGTASAVLVQRRGRVGCRGVCGDIPSFWSASSRDGGQPFPPPRRWRGGSSQRTCGISATMRSGTSYPGGKCLVARRSAGDGGRAWRPPRGERCAVRAALAVAGAWGGGIGGGWPGQLRAAAGRECSGSRPGVNQGVGHRGEGAGWYVWGYRALGGGGGGEY